MVEIKPPKCEYCNTPMELLPPAPDDPPEAKDVLVAFCEKCGKFRVNFGHGWVRP